MDIDADSSCRICLMNCAVRSIFSTKKCYNSTKVTCLEMMSTVFSFKVEQANLLPSKVCQKCFCKLSSAYKLKVKAEYSNKILLGHFFQGGREEDIKDEVKSEDEVIKNEEIDLLYDTSNLEITDDKSNLEIKNESLDDHAQQDGVEVPVDVDDRLSSESDDDNLPLSAVTNPSLSPAAPKKSVAKRKPVVKAMKAMEAEKKLRMCDLCGKRVANMTEHRLTHSTTKRRLPCGECPKVFTSYSTRRRHRKVIHRGELFYCQICKKHVKHGSAHMSSQHSTRPKPFRCPHCDKAYPVRSQLASHLTVHSKEKAFSCPVCGKLFRTRGLSTQHKKSVHDKEKPHICQYCSKAFFSLFILTEHVRTHTNERPHKCGECGKGFFSSSTLRDHLLRHAGVKKYPCEHCDKHFTPGNMKIHMLSHTKEKTHPCKYCGVKFGRAYHRSRHEKTAHESRLKFR